MRPSIVVPATRTALGPASATVRPMAQPSRTALYRELELRRRRAQIAARHALEAGGVAAPLPRVRVA